MNMAKYMKKPEIVEVNPYRFGMEDGFVFVNTNEFIPANGELFYENMRSEKYPRYLKLYEHYIDKYNEGKLLLKPYINTKDGIKSFDEQDMLITESDGSTYPCNRKEFEAAYVLAE